ncbi:MAG: hypothetical protein GY888_15375 [Planctomycetaceae bacterium]|nr:hypothetical protein [Planctomycetaceae bacterium]
MAWTCPHCRTPIESQFQNCWKCGTDIDGQLDENFSVETDPDELTDDPEIPRIHCTHCNYKGKVLFSTKSKSGLDWAVAGLVSIVVSQRSWIHFCHKICPKCGAPWEGFHGWSGEIGKEDERTWKKATALENRRAAKNRRFTCLTIGSLAMVSLVVWLALR